MFFFLERFDFLLKQYMCPVCFKCDSIICYKAKEGASMNSEELYRLRRENMALKKELGDVVERLKESQSALVVAQAAVSGIVEFCRNLINSAVRAPTLLETERERMNALLDDVNDTGWIEKLHYEAFERGFEAAREAGENKESVLSAVNAKTRDLFYSSYRRHCALAMHPSFFIKSPEEKPSRYQYSPENIDGPFDYDDNGTFTDYACYHSLKIRYDFIKESLEAYKALFKLHDASISINNNANASRKRLRRPRKEGVLKAKFGTHGGEADLFILYGDNVPFCDRALLMHALTSKRMAFCYDKKEPFFESSLIDELKKRGYDIETLSFSISRHQGESDGG